MFGFESFCTTSLACVALPDIGPSSAHIFLVFGFFDNKDNAIVCRWRLLTRANILLLRLIAEHLAAWQPLSFNNTLDNFLVMGVIIVE